MSFPSVGGDLGLELPLLHMCVLLIGLPPDPITVNLIKIFKYIHWLKYFYSEASRAGYSYDESLPKEKKKSHPRAPLVKKIDIEYNMHF